MKLLRLSLYSFIAVIFLFLTAIATLIYCGNSPQYSAWLVNKLSQKSSGKFAYTRFSGSLLQEFSIDGVSLHFAAQNISIANLHLSWKPIELLKWQFAIDKLVINDVQWNDFSETKEQTHISHVALHLPWWLSVIDLEDIQIHQLYFHQKKNRITFNSLQASAYLAQTQCQLQFLLDRLEIASSSFSSALDHQKINIHGELKGNLKSYDWKLNVMPEKHPAFEFSGTGTDSDISLMHIQSSKWPKTLNFSMHFRWYPYLAMQSSLQGTLDPKLWIDSSSGHLLVDANFDGEHLDDAMHHWQLNLHQLAGKVKGRNIQGHGTITDANHRLIWKDWHIQVAQSFMEIAGELSRQSQLTWNISIPNLAYWVPKSTGEIYSKGNLQGDMFSPDLSSTANIKNVKLWMLQIKQLDLIANIHAQAKNFFMNINGTQWQWQQYNLDLFSLQTKGTLLEHSISLQLANKLAKLTANLQGNLHEETWNGVLQSLSIAPKNNLAWQIKTPVTLSVSQDTFVMNSPLCLLQNKDSICIKFNRHKDDKAFFLQTSRINLAFLQKFFPDKISDLQGMAKVDAFVSFNQDWRPLGNIAFQCWPVRLTYHLKEDKSLPIRIQGSAWQLNIDKTHAILTGNLKSNFGTLDANIQLPQWFDYLSSNWLSQPISGKVNWNLNDLSFLQIFFDALSNVKGKLNAALDIAGTLQTPKVQLLAEVTQGEVHLIPYNLNLKNILIKLDGWSNEALNLTGRLNSGDGLLNFSGSVENLFSSPILKLHLKGNHVLLSNLPSYQVWASPSLDFLLSSTQLGLTGNLLIPEANLQFVDYENKVVTLTDDVVYSDEAQQRFNFASNILLTLGDKVRLRYGGLTGRLTGKLQLNQTGNAPATAVGAIYLVDGQYKAYGQALTIQKGEAAYKGGNVDNPILNIQAVKVLQNVTPLTADGAMLSTGGWISPDGNLTVGVSITGPLSERRTELFSVPAGLSQGDILSYLILGVPSSQAGSGGGQLLLSAASSLSGGQGGGPISELQNQLKNTLGIEVGVGTVSQYNPSTQSTAQGTALILTKSLSPKLFFTYSAGTGQTVSVFKVRYQINQKWFAQTESSSLGNGGDIYYTISRD